MGNVTLKNVRKDFGDVNVVKNINLEIQDGEFIVLVGPSGCGKSTILRMVAGLEDITDGTISITDKAINDLAPHKRNIAMVFQNYALYPHKSVRENIVFGLKKAGASKELMAERLNKVSEMLQLEPYLDRKPADLSGGQRQRVAMGRALVRDAEVFLFDEPLSNLDAKLRHHMRTEIAKIHQKYHTTTIYVTHDQVEAMTLGDRVVVLKDGNIEQVGTPMEIYLNPVNTFIATFIGSPSMNLLNAKIKDNQIAIGDHQLAIDSLNLKTDISNKKEIIVGIRPDFFDDAAHNPTTDKHITFKNLKIDLVEPLGFDHEINFTISSNIVKARLDLRTNKNDGENIDLIVNTDRILLFDAQNNSRIV